MSIAPNCTPPWYHHRRKGMVLSLLFLLAGALVWHFWNQDMLSSAGMLAAVREHALLAPLAFMGIYAISMVFLIPTLPLNLGAGFLWGPLLGGLYSLCGSTLGAIAAFLFARTAFGQPMARSFKVRVFRSLAAMLERGGWKVVAFARLNPAVPTGAVNFLFGLTSLSLWTYAWGSFVFFFPLCYLFAYLGNATGGFILDGDLSRLVRIVAVSLGFGLFLLAGKQLLSRGKNGAENQAGDPSEEEPPAV